MWATQPWGSVGLFMVAVTGSVLLAGVAATTAAASDGVPQSGRVPVTERAHTHAGSDIRIESAKFTHGNRRVTARVVWNKTLRAERGNHRYSVRVESVAKGKGHRGTVLAASTRTSVGQRSRVQFWLSTSQTRTARAARTVLLSVSQQYDNPRDGDSKYEKNYVSSVYLKGSPPSQPSGYRDCSHVEIGPHADLSTCQLSYANLMRANLRDANLTGADLSFADLSFADLTFADLTGVDLTDANLTGARLTLADLTGVDLTRANLTGVDLARANLTGVDLNRAKLPYANLTGADLVGKDMTLADLTRADLTRANLSGANLSGADLSGADLSGADLSGADLTGADLTAADLSAAIWTDGGRCRKPSIGRCNHSD